MILITVTELSSPKQDSVAWRAELGTLRVGLCEAVWGAES